MDSAGTGDSSRADVQQIAAEHEAIFDRLHGIYRRLMEQSGGPYDGIVDGLRALGDELIGHFNTEEAFMRRVAYPGSEDHFSDHAMLTRLIHRMTEAADQGNHLLLTEDLPLVIHAILQHLCGEDRDMDGFLVQQQGRKAPTAIEKEPVSVFGQEIG